jgi:hypothetical protein
MSPLATSDSSRDGGSTGWLPISVECTAQTNKLTAWLYYDQDIGYWRQVCFDDVYLSEVLDSVQECRCVADGTRVAVHDLVVTATKAQLGDKVYVEAQDRTAGIQLYFGADPCTAVVGDIVTVEGRMTTRNGERAIESPVITKTGTLSPVLGALGMSTCQVGGMDYDCNGGPPAIGQRGPNQYGVNNVGLLVRCAGAVTVVGDNYIYINDGCSSGSGLKVLLNGASMPAEGDMVAVTGISGLVQAGPDVSAILTARQPADFQVVPKP